MLIRWASPIILATAVVTNPVWSFLPRGVSDKAQPNDSETQNTHSNELLFEDTLEALRVMQDAYFEPWVGTWPKSIDWTAAVMGSHIAGALVSLSRGLQETYEGSLERYRAKENLISFYFSQLVGFYFGQNALSLRHQAYDDMLWVVLNWLDAIQFISEHSSTNPLDTLDTEREEEQLATESLHNQSWHGNLWVPAFSHRARVFWELAAKGWDEELCGGGMFWNPRLGPYKNAITNELFISASISMYKYFPGDVNTSPYDFSLPNPDNAKTPGKSNEWQPHDPKYLTAAVKGYRWLMASNMTNNQGLFTDGFHMSNWPGNHSRCDRRDEMVYTYNQGVILTSQLELFRTTGDIRYLHQGHQLIQNVIRATGWDLAEDEPVDDIDDLSPGQLPPWRGLGRAGILEEVCDPVGTCSQNSHTFKGIWMHHFTAFCSPFQPLTLFTLFLDEYTDVGVEYIKESHGEACQRYLGWIRHNAFAARRTRDSEGKFGMWWTAGLLNITIGNLQIGPDSLPSSEGAVDYRTYGAPNDPVWMGTGSVRASKLAGTWSKRGTGIYDGSSAQRPLGVLSNGEDTPGADIGAGSSSDPNTRGRGRTVETQGGGLAVLRALWELSNQGE